VPPTSFAKLCPMIWKGTGIEFNEAVFLELHEAHKTLTQQLHGIIKVIR
jgi:hypothetical protein